MKFSPSTRGFYDPAIHGTSIPPDAVDITNAEHAAILAAQSAGKSIKADINGRPVLVDTPEPTDEQVAAIYEAELDKMLDGVAQVYRYGDRTRLALRAGYPNQHQALAIAFGTWMDSCNDQAKQLYIDVKAGIKSMPTLEQFIAGFPAFVAP